MTRFRMARLWIPVALLVLGSVNVFGDTITYFSATQLFPSTQPPFPLPGTSSSVSGIVNGAPNSARADLATGSLGVLNAGTDATVGGVQENIAQIGDTISATGTTASGLTGLNLGVNLSMDGTSTFTNPGDNFTVLWVYIFQDGTFDQPQFTIPGNVLFSEGFMLGNGTASGNADALSTANDVKIDGTFGDGSENIPLIIPFSNLAANFQIELVLISAEVVSPGSTWDADFSHTATISLEAPDGVTLTSASGLLPGTSAASAPEPGSVLLAGLGIVILAVWRNAKREQRA
jgi:hypothetical protein